MFAHFLLAEGTGEAQMLAISLNKAFCSTGCGAEWIRSFGVARSLAEGKRDQRLVIFRVELCWHPRENEFAVSSVRYPTLAVKFSVARMRPGLRHIVRRTQGFQGHRSQDQFS